MSQSYQQRHDEEGSPKADGTAVPRHPPGRLITKSLRPLMAQRDSLFCSWG